MSTQHTDIDKVQEAPPQTPGSFFREETLQRENLPPATHVPPPRRPTPSRRNYWFVVAAVIVALALIFSVFALVVSLQGQHPATQVTPTPTAPQTTVTTTPGSETTPAPTQVVTQVPTPINTPAYWDRILGTAGTNGKVESVSFAHILGNSSLQALVTVRHSDANSTLDVYVFDRITSATPTQLFKLSGLIKGDAKISGYNSIMTAEVNPNSMLNAGTSVSQITPDAYREFAWVKGSMTQVAFPGIFPVMTRYQAEADQARVNAGHDTWKNDATAVAKALEVQFMKWQRTVTTKVLKGGGPNDVSATVQVQGTPILSAQPTIVVTLSRLEGKTHNIWEAIGVKDGSTLTLTNIPTGSLISSPVTLTGTGSAYEAVIGQGVVYDHLYTNIGHEQLTGSPGMGIANYSIKVPYSSSFKGAQEGIVVAYQDMGGLSSGYSSAVVVKVLIGG
jgi:hypothetical protein